MVSAFIQVTGWLGVALYISGYALLSFNRLQPDSVTYHVLNAGGGICLVIFSLSIVDVPNTIVNAVWILIAGISLIRIMRVKLQRKSLFKPE